MKRRKRGAAVIVSLTSLAAFAAVMSSGTAQSGAGEVEGDFSLILMVHTENNQFGDPLPGVVPWDGTRRQGARYVYRSIPCTGNAPVNNISSDLPSYGTRVAGSRVPASTRGHPLSFRTVRKKGRWQMRGTILLTVCKLGPGPTPQEDPVPDEQKPRIIVRFKSGFTRLTTEEISWQGRFRLAGGTGRYEDLTGSGDIAGYFFCFDPAGCAASGGKYLDGQLVMHGTYADPTPELENQG